MAVKTFPPALTHSRVALVHQGKTRDSYRLRGDVSSDFQAGKRLVVATNRLSTHNVVHESTIPFKGEVLTALTVFWLTEVVEAAGIPHHLIAFGRKIYEHLTWSRTTYPRDLHRRAIVVKELQMIPTEFIWRNYLCGSLYESYYKKGLADPYGLELHNTPGLQLMTHFNNPAFTPTDKSETDDPVSGLEVGVKYPEAHTLTYVIFKLVTSRMRQLGLELVDSKFEVGVDEDGVPRIADEVATPDSSRYCELNQIQLGVNPPWLDKQVARDEAERIWAGGKKIPLRFGSRTVAKLSDTYLDVFQRITGQSLDDFHRLRMD